MKSAADCGGVRESATAAITTGEAEGAGAACSDGAGGVTTNYAAGAGEPLDKENRAAWRRDRSRATNH